MHPTDEQITALAEAMWQVLDDMGASGTSCCLAAKAAARIAYEPFRDLADYENWMSLDDAKAIIADIEN